MNTKQQLLEKIKILETDIQNDVYSEEEMREISKDIPFQYNVSTPSGVSSEIIKYLFRGWYLTKIHNTPGDYT